MSQTRIAPRPYPNLKTWREAKTLTSRQAARALGISLTKYNRLERAERFVKGPEAKRLMQETGVPIEVLVGAA